MASSYRLITRAEDLSEIANKIESLTPSDLLPLDIETTDLKPRKGRIRTIQFAFGSDLVVIDLWATGGPGPLVVAMRRFRGIWLAHNAKFEAAWLLYHWGVDLGTRIFDTMHASKWLHNGRGKVVYNEKRERNWLEWKHGYWDVLARELQTKPDVVDMQKGPWDAELTPQHLAYAVSDVQYLVQLRDALRSKLFDHGLAATMATEMAAIVPMAAIELAGLAVDADQYRGVVAEEERAANESEKLLRALLPNPDDQLDLFGETSWNVDSPQQLLKALQKAGIEVEGTSKRHMKTWDFTHPVTKALLAYRKHSTRVKMFGHSWLGYVEDGRVYGDYWALLETGRLSVRKPNTTQLPRDEAYRACFKAPPGRKLVICDYAQIELRIAAEIANEPTMVKAIIDGKDLHKVTAAEVLGAQYESVTKSQKQNAKAVNFGLIYQMRQKKYKEYAAINYDVFLSQEEANRDWEKYHAFYSGVGRWHRQCERQVKSGSVRCIGGRRRYLDPSYHYNEGSNTPVQGTGAGMLKDAIRLIYDRTRHLDTKIVVTPHDETVSECSEEAAPEVRRIVEESMLEAAQKYLKKVPVKADAEICNSWADKP